MVHRLLTAVASLAVERGSRRGASVVQRVGSAVVVQGLRCSRECEIFLEQGSNLSLPH